MFASVYTVFLGAENGGRLQHLCAAAGERRFSLTISASSVQDIDQISLLHHRRNFTGP